MYNGWEYLRQCAASIFAQEGFTGTWDWWIGINGHGESGGLAAAAAKVVLDDAPPSLRHRIHIVNLHPIKGKVDALNALTGKTTAPWIALLDCDDMWLPTKLAAQWEAICGPAAPATFAACVGTPCFYIGADTEQPVRPGPNLPIGAIPRKTVLEANPIINSSVLLRRQHAHWTDRCGLEDYDLWLRLVATGHTLYNLARPLTLHRLHDASAFNGKGQQDLVGLRNYWRVFFNPPRLATVVSAYYAIPSKFPAARYIEWITPFWSQTYCPLVFFTSPELKPIFEKAFQGRPGPTRIEAVPFQELAAFHKLTPDVWTKAHAIDPERDSVQHSPELYAIWYEKKEFVSRAITLDPFKTEGFVWCDAGICRYPQWIPSLAQRFPQEERIPRGQMLVLTIDPFKEEDAIAQSDGIRGSFGLRNTVGGGILASDRKGWDAWSRAYDAMLMRYYLAGRFIGKDQNIMGSMILEQPGLALTVPRFTSLTSQQSWFSLLFYLAALEPV